MRSEFPTLLARWRTHKRVSQLDLAMTVDVSQRHVSFLEVGRSQPSRDMVLRLAQGLDLPLRARNELLLAAGFAPHYPERRLEAAEMDVARRALDHILQHHEPFPAIATDADWNIVGQNAAATRLVAFCLAAHPAASRSPPPIGNFMRLMFDDAGLRPFVRNWAVTRNALIKRLAREAAASPGSPSDRLRKELQGAEAAGSAASARLDDPLAPVLPLELLVEGRTLKLFGVFATFGTPQDVGLQELRIDLSFPADEPTRKFFVDAIAP